jgi:hypothetical protein
MECPRCQQPIPEGSKKCRCGYDPAAPLPTGRPSLEGSTELASAPRGLGLNGTMLLGLALAGGGVALLMGADKGFLSNLEHRDVIAWVAVGVGTLRFLRGRSL